MKRLQGTGANAGSGPVEGIAIVVHGAQEAGERLQVVGDGRPVILCINSFQQCEFSLLRQVRGLVIETSPLLSNTMVVARELGLPVVTGLGAAIDAIPDGQAVSVDGAAGTVEVVGWPRSYGASRISRSGSRASW